MDGIRFMPQGIRWATIAGIFFIAGACELTRAQARPDSPPVTMKPSATDQNAQAESELRAGIALTLGGHFAEAIAHLLEAQGRVSNEYAAEFNLALCYAGTGQFQKAISVLTALRRRGSDNASVENLLAQAYAGNGQAGDRKSTRLNSSHITISYAVFCLKKKKKNNIIRPSSASTSKPPRPSTSLTIAR